MTIGERIRLIRKEKHMTQKQVAEKCGMADSAIRKYESGSVTPKFDTLDRIASALGVPVTALMGYVYQGKDSSGNDVYAPPNDTIVFRTSHTAPIAFDEKKIMEAAGIDMSDVDIAFYGDYSELSEDDQKVIRDMVKLMRERREKKKPQG